MDSYVDNHDTDVNFSNMASIFGIWHEICEAQENVYENEVCALIQSVFQKGCSRLKWLKQVQNSQLKLYEAYLNGN